MNYLKFIFTIPDDLQEFIIAELLDLDVYGFEQLDGELIAYVEKPRFNDSHREEIEEMLLMHAGCSFREVNEIEEENWNEKWEQTIQPQQVGQFLVKPTWSDALPQGDSILLEIDPDRKSTRLNSSHVAISYAVFCLKKKKIMETTIT